MTRPAQDSPASSEKIVEEQSDEPSICPVCDQLIREPSEDSKMKPCTVKERVRCGIIENVLEFQSMPMILQVSLITLFIVFFVCNTTTILI